MGPCVHFLWDPSITHKLIFGQICVHEILMGPCVISYGTLPISHKLNFGKHLWA